jgi:hypothetical protein
VGFRDWFKKVPPPLPFEDPRLGPLQWSSEHDGWYGTLNGLKFILGHDPNEQPPEALKNYAYEILCDRAFLEQSLAEAIRTAPGYYRGLTDEMNALKYDELHFSISRKGRMLFATLEPGAVNRFWRLEFFERRCDGIGFDS